MPQGTTTSNFADLPPELVAEILKWLDKRSKIEARLVCHTWTALMDSLHFDHNIILSNLTFPFVMKVKSLVPKKVKKLIVKEFNLDVSSYPQSVSRSPLALSAKAIIFRKNRTLNNLWIRTAPQMVQKGSSEDNISRVLRLNSEAESLVFSSGSLNHVRELSVSRLVMNNLSHFKLSISLYGQREFQLIRQMENIRMPNLRSLELEVGIFTLNNFVNDQTMFQLLHVLAAHPVRKLKLSHFLSLRFDGHSVHAPISICPPPEPESVRKLQSKLEQIQVEDLSVKFIPRNGVVDYDLGCHFLACQRQLVSLHMEIYPRREGNDMKERTRLAIAQNALSLRHLDVSCDGYGDRCWLLVSYIEEIWQSMLSCRNLESIDLGSFWIRTLLYPLPRTLTKLILGLIRPNVLHQLRTAAPNLHTLEFSGLAHEHRPNSERVTDYLASLLAMRSMKIIKWRSDGDVAEYLNGREGIRITRIVEASKYKRSYEFITVTKME